MAKTKEEIVLAWLPHAMQKALAELQHRLGRPYRFAIENPTEEQFEDVLMHAVKLQNSGSSKRQINNHKGYGKGFVPVQWLRKLKVTIRSNRRNNWDIESPRYFEPEFIKPLHDYLRNAVKHLLKREAWEFVDCTQGFDKEGGGHRTKVVLQRRDGSTFDGQSMVVETLTIDYYAEGSIY